MSILKSLQFKHFHKNLWWTRILGISEPGLIEFSDLSGSFKTLAQRSHCPDFLAGRWAFKELAFEGIRRRHHVRVLLDRVDSLQFNSTWDAQIDHQDGGGVLEIIGSLLSSANFAVCESRGTPTIAASISRVDVYAYVSCVCARARRISVYMYMYVIGPRTSYTESKSTKLAPSSGEKCRALMEICLHDFVVLTTRRLRQT